MSQEKRPLFREHALQQYMQRRQLDVLPRVVSPPVFVFVWVLFTLLVLAGIASWWVRVPTFVDGDGVIATPQSSTRVGTFTAQVFFPATSSSLVHAGLAGQLQIGNADTYIPGKVIQSGNVALTPDQVRHQYAFVCNATQLFSQPTIAVEMRGVSAYVHPGDTVHARLQIGSQRVLSLLPVLGQWIGE